LAVYQRLSGVKYRYELEDVQEDLKDRYGAMPELVRTFFEMVWRELV
jgi:transcription-repair coupling factor (superfamily II helicase)